jgi:uncharacterized protein (TIGR02611 family)
VTTEDQRAAPAAGRTPVRSRYATFRARIRERPGLHLTWRIVIGVVGSLILAAGLLGLVAPILPGWALIFVGLGLLASEFSWARRLLGRARRTYEYARMRALDPAVRRRNQVIGTMVAVLLVLGTSLYVLRYGFALPWEVWPLW